MNPDKPDGDSKVPEEKKQDEETPNADKPEGINTVIDNFIATVKAISK